MARYNARVRTIVTRGVARRPQAWILALACLVGCGAPEPLQEAASPPPRTPANTEVRQEDTSAATRIVFLGDSLTAGYGIAEGDAFPALVALGLERAGHDVEVLNAGVSGDTSAGGVSRIDWVLRARPDVLVLELGGNDALRGQPLENTERNLRIIVERAREAGARVIILGMDVPTNYGPDYGGRFSAMYARIAEDLDVAYVPGFIREVGLNRGLMQLDGIHPTAAGHRRLAELLLPHLEALIEQH